MNDEKLTLEKTLEWFCDKSYSSFPTDAKSKLKILPRMRAVGFITDSEMKTFEEEINEEEKIKRETKKPKW